MGPKEHARSDTTVASAARKSGHGSPPCREGLQVPQALVTQGGEQSCSGALHPGMDTVVLR